MKHICAEMPDGVRCGDNTHPSAPYVSGPGGHFSIWYCPWCATYLGAEPSRSVWRRVRQLGESLEQLAKDMARREDES